MPGALTWAYLRRPSAAIFLTGANVVPLNQPLRLLLRLQDGPPEQPPRNFEKRLNPHSGALLARLRSARGQVRVGRSPHPACGGGTHGGKGAGRSAVPSARAPRPRPGFAAAGAAGRRVLRARLRVAWRAGRGRGAGGSRKRTQVRAGGSGPRRARLAQRVRPSPALSGRGCSGRCSSPS
ncbi:C-type natriuretic peptide-like [Acinonyx jubatus]|uniref:C-type natriuretic peptide-like n=1 Tax=Acinonyx jubatus TaxID=32536 RepID=A0ABM3Q0I2_ACIJB|nr:C-type natriuretic peptide-like [Acinonyx jubatus]